MRYLRRIFIFRQLARQLRLTWLLLRNPGTPLWLKCSGLGALLYLVIPLDLLPDFLLILGQLDDLGVLFAWMKILERLSPADVLTAARSHLRT